jgi:hypothetical protein
MIKIDSAANFSGCGTPRYWNAESALIRCHQIIGNEQECADDGDDLAAMAHTGVHAAAVRIKPADNYVVDPNERGQHAH